MDKPQDTAHRYIVYPKDDYEIAKLWTFAYENDFMIFKTIKHYFEFYFIYKGIIVDLDHKTIQGDACEVTGGWGKKMDSIFDLISLFNHINKPYSTTP